MRFSPTLAGCMVAALLATATAAQMASPASADDVVAAVRACAAVTSASGVDGDRLTSLGWHAATASPPGIRFFGNPPNRALIAVERTGATATCAASAGLSSPQALDQIVSGLQAAFGPPAGRTSKSAHWVNATNIVDLAQRVSADGSAALRVDVRPKSGEGK